MSASKRILFVDDDDDFAEAMATRCRELGLSALTARNVLTAMSIAEKWQPDVVCLDVNMPTGNGLDVCEFLAQDAGLSRARFVVLTGRTDRPTMRRSLELSAHYLAKSPAAWQQLRELLYDLLPELRPACDVAPSAN
ncbi:MAG: hypothetical protein DCC68_01065 [Planctomycetota bacterium]|nr:MAG: hypothetical protein DCC68_01065 [Planctomycetota bacterium]